MSSNDGRVRVVAVGQTPPPVGGQAVAIQSFVTGRYRDLEVFHVKMAFSEQTEDIGRPTVRKVLHLIGLIVRILWCRMHTGATVLYYPPAGPDLVPVLRDLFVLLCTRPAFRATVFHFHAAGVSEIERRLPRPMQALFQAAYGRPELAIQTSTLNPPDGERLGARRIEVVANGVPDHPLAHQENSGRSRPPVLLYAGVLSESKGLLVLVEACRQLRQRDVDFRLHLMGAFASHRFETGLRESLARGDLSEHTVFLGLLNGDAKAASYGAADVFCYPTHFEAESFGLVVVEAMQFSLPVVATEWRGVPSVVADGESGLLVPIRDPERLAGALNKLLESPALRQEMGRRGRELYLERFTEARYRQNMEAALRCLSPTERQASGS